MIDLLGPDATIVRTAWLSGPHGANFVKTMLRLAGERDRTEVTVVDDQLGSPSFTFDVAATIRSLAVARLPGVFHVTNEGTTTWFGLARAVFGLAGHDPGRVVPIPSDQLQPRRPAPRPSFSVLDNAARRGLGLGPLPEYEESLERLVKELS
jgi:dTDP-4-dehydrorhamnose reductase